jgi:DNA-binding NtrC family response regulator
VGYPVVKCEEQRKILVADDEDVILFSYKKLYSHNSVRVDVCKTADAAYEMIRDTTYDVVISDVRFSDSDCTQGLDILAYIKERSPMTKVIIMTGYGSAELKERAMSLGAYCYLDKPVEISRVDQILSTLGLF